MDAQDPSDHSMNGGDNLLSGDLSHMHWEKDVFEVYKSATTQYCLTHSAKVMWGLQVFGLHEECTNLELGMTWQAPKLLVETTTTAEQFLDDYVCLSFCAYSLNHGHMSDRVFKKS